MVESTTDCALDGSSFVNSCKTSKYQRNENSVGENSNIRMRKTT